MSPRQATALACFYFVGWAIVLGLVIATAPAGGQYRVPAFMTVYTSQTNFNNFMTFVVLLWLLYTIPCLLVTLLVRYATKSKTAPFRGADRRQGAP